MQVTLKRSGSFRGVNIREQGDTFIRAMNGKAYMKVSSTYIQDSVRHDFLMAVNLESGEIAKIGMDEKVTPLKLKVTEA